MTRVRTANSHDAAPISSIFQAAFVDDPTWFLEYPDKTRRANGIAEYYRMKVEQQPERVDVAVSDDDRILGALRWQPPTQSFKARAGLSAARLASRVAGPVSKRWGGLANTIRVKAHLPFSPHWYIHDVVVDANTRGQGIGSELLRHRLALIDQTSSSPVFLEATTAGSRRLYERHGFRAVATIPTTPGNESTVMVRESSAKSA